jgi:acyl-CoA synthetase (NDP forming)
MLATNPVPLAAIERLLKPRSVAIVGASDKPGALGATVLGNLERAGFAGEIYPINPKREAIGSRRCFPSVEALPEGVDVAVLAIPRGGVLEAVRQLAHRKVGGAIIFSAGFAEGGEQGLADQCEIASIASEAGMVVLGPNCLGATNFIDDVALTFVEMPEPRVRTGAQIGIVSQSGAMAGVLAVTLMSRDLPLSMSISTGNEAASGVEDFVDYLIADPDTRVIAMIVEQFRSPRRFLDLVAKARGAGKQIVLLHPGKSSAARESAATHTGAMAGDYQVMRVLVERAGVLLAESIEELSDIAEIAVRSPTPPKGGTAVIAESGAFKALTLDFCEEIGLPLPPLDAVGAPAVRQALPEFVGVSNPLDITAQGLVDPGIYARLIHALVPDERFGTIVVAIIQTDPVTCNLKFPAILDALDASRPAKPVIFAGLDEGAEVPADYITSLRQLGVTYLPSTERAFRAIKRLRDFSERDFDSTETHIAVNLDLPAEGGVIPEYRAKALLRPLGVPFPDGRFATTRDEAKAAANAVGYPVAMKAQAAALSHKTDAGGVILNLADEQSVEHWWDRMCASVAAYDSSVALDGALIEPMGAPGTELIVGARNDPEWGPVILVGFGGVMAELLHDVRLLPADLTKSAIVRELNLLKSGQLLRGFRGSPPLDVDAVAEIVLVLGPMLRAEPRIREIDLNPVIVYPRGAVALDALMLVEPATSSTGS